MKFVYALSLCILILLQAVFADTAYGQLISPEHFNLEDGVAIRGFDPVSYFEGKPRPGTKSLALELGGVRFLFSSEGNKRKFASNPLQYLPQYGGWCAYAMGTTGQKVTVDPETYKIVDGKLYLFYNRFFNNTLVKWNADENRLLPLADANWVNTLNLH